METGKTQGQRADDLVSHCGAGQVTEQCLGLSFPVCKAGLIYPAPPHGCYGDPNGDRKAEGISKLRINKRQTVCSLDGYLFHLDEIRSPSEEPQRNAPGGHRINSAPSWGEEPGVTSAKALGGPPRSAPAQHRRPDKATP